MFSNCLNFLIEKKRFKTVLFSICLIPVLHAGAQERYSFDACVQQALKENPEYRFDELEFQKAVAAHRSAALNRLPDLNANINTSLNNGRALDPITYQYNTQTFLFNNISLHSRLMLFDGNRTNIQIDQTALFSEVQKLKLGNTRLNMEKDILSAYTDILKYTEFTTLWQQRIQKLNVQKTQLELQVEGGRKTLTSVLEIEIEISKTQQSLEEVKFRKAIAELKLKNILNLPSNQLILIDRLPESSIVFDTTTISPERMNNIVAQTYGYKEATAQTLLAQLDIRKAKSFYKPSLSLNGMIATGYSSRFQNASMNISGDPASQFNNNFYQNISLNLYLPVFNRFQTSYNVRKYKLSRLQSDVQKDKTQLLLHETIATLDQEARLSAHNYFFIQKALAQFDPIVREAELNLTYGRIDLFEYLYKEQQKFTLEQNNIEWKYRYIVSAKCIELFENGTVNLK